MKKKKQQPISIRLDELPKDELLRIVAIVCQEGKVIDFTASNQDGKEILLDGSHIVGCSINPLFEPTETISISREFLQTICSIFGKFDNDYLKIGFAKDKPLQFSLKIDEKIVNLYLAPRVEE